MDKVIEKIVWLLPRKFLYFSVLRAWAIASTEKFRDKEPDEIKWYEVCKYFEK